MFPPDWYPARHDLFRIRKLNNYWRGLGNRRKKYFLEKNAKILGNDSEIQKIIIAHLSSLSYLGSPPCKLCFQSSANTLHNFVFCEIGCDWQQRSITFPVNIRFVTTLHGAIGPRADTTVGGWYYRPPFPPSCGSFECTPQSGSSPIFYNGLGAWINLNTQQATRLVIGVANLLYGLTTGFLWYTIGTYYYFFERAHEF